MNSYKNADNKSNFGLDESMNVCDFSTTVCK